MLLKRRKSARWGSLDAEMRWNKILGPFSKVPPYHMDLQLFHLEFLCPVAPPLEKEALLDTTMTSRGRTRRHGSAGSNYFTLSSSKVVRLGMVVILMSSALYLFCTHTFVSREHDSSNVSSRDGRFNPSNPKAGEAIHRPGDPNFHYGSQVAYEEDPRNPGGVRPSEVVGAQSRMDYVELRCEGGKTPDVDLSYWKDIVADK